MGKIIILTVVLIGGSLQLPRAEPEVHLIPKGYVGWVTIAFGAANGVSPVYEDDARLYRIPSGGVLITQAAPNIGSSPTWRFFLRDPEGTRTPILLIWPTTVHDTEANRADPSVGIFYMRRGRQQAGRLPCDVEYDQYFVGTKGQLLSSVDRQPYRSVSEYLAKHYQCRPSAANMPLQPTSGIIVTRVSESSWGDLLIRARG